MDAVFDAEAWEARLLDVVEDGLEKAARRGATTELGQVEGEEGKAAPTGSTPIPSGVLDAIQSWLADSLNQPHWSAVNQNVRDDIARVMRQGIEEGQSGKEQAEAVRQALAGTSQGRAERIARTEATGALNAGHEAARVDLAERGLILGKRWLAIIDGDTRAEHSAANGQRVEPGKDFRVGGEACAYPGDNRLSAAQRVRCRCTTISVTALDDDD